MWRLLFGLFALPIVLLELSVLTDAGFTPWALVNVVAYPVLQTLSIALHEGGHALVGRAVGLRVARVDLGVGRRLFQWQWGRTKLGLHAFPTLGLTFLGGERLEGLRGRLWLAVAAGPLVTAGVIAGALAWPEPMRLVDGLLPAGAFASRLAVRESLVFGNFWMLVLNLVPLPFFRGLGLSSNDGAQLLSLPFRSAARMRELLIMPDLLEAQELSEQGDDDAAQRVLEEAARRVPDSYALRNSLALVLLNRKRWDEARQVFLALLEEEPPQPEYRLLMRNNVAWASFCARRDELRAEADAHSAAVFARFKQAAWAQGTRGAVLFWLGRFEEAEGLLERAYTGNSMKSQRAANACCLAMSLAARGRLPEAERWLERAQANHPACWMLPEARSAVEAARASSEASAAR